MALNAEQQARTREELRANFALCGRTPEQAAHDLGFSAEKLDDALNLRESVHPADVWLLRDYLEREVVARGELPEPFTVLTARSRFDAATWFTQRPPSGS